jgi:hypothetical protein
MPARPSGEGSAGDQHAVGGDERVDGEEPEVGRAVEHDGVEPGAGGLEGPLEHGLLGDAAGEALLDGQEAGVGAGDPQPVDGGGGRDVGDVGAGAVAEHPRQRAAGLGDAAAQREVDVPLGVEVHEQHPEPVEPGPRGGDGHGGGGLAHAALLRGDGEDEAATAGLRGGGAAGGDDRAGSEHLDLRDQSAPRALASQYLMVEVT